MISTKEKEQISEFNFPLTKNYSIKSNKYCYVLNSKINGNVLFITDLNTCLNKSVKWLEKHNQSIDEKTKQKINELKKLNTDLNKQINTKINNFIQTLS